MMKTKNMLPIIAVLLIGLFGGCSKDQDSFLSSEMNSIKMAKNAGNLAAINLGLAGEFVILSKTGITDVFKSSVVGDVGTSPITGAALLLKCNEVTGTI